MVRLYTKWLGLGWLFILSLLATSCGRPGVNDEIPITTDSEEARDLFIEARILSENLRHNEARKLIEKAIAADPNFALAHFYRAEVAISSADRQKHLRKAVSLLPRVSEGEQLLVKAGHASFKENIEQRRTILLQLANLYPRDKRVHWRLGMTYGEKQSEDAIKAYKKAIKLDKEFPPVYNNLGYHYAGLGRYKKAERAFQDYIKLIPEEPNPYDSMADLYFAMGDLEQSTVYYEKAVSKSATFTPSRYKRARNLVFLGRYEEARDEFAQNAELETNDREKIFDWMGVASSYVFEGDYGEAFTTFDQAYDLASQLSLAFDVRRIQFFKALALIEAGRYDEAGHTLTDLEDKLRATELEERYSNLAKRELLTGWTILDVQRGDVSQAAARLQNIPVPPEDIPGLKGTLTLKGIQAYIALNSGNPTEAIELIKGRDLDHPLGLWTLAEAHRESGDSSKAREFYEKIVNLRRLDDPYYPFVYAMAEAMLN